MKLCVIAHKGVWRQWKDVSPVRAVLGPEVLLGLLQAAGDPFEAISVDLLSREASAASVVPHHGSVAHVELQTDFCSPVAVVDVSGPTRSSEEGVQKPHCLEIIMQVSYT